MGAESSESTTASKPPSDPRADHFAALVSADDTGAPLSLFMRTVATPAAFGDADCRYFEFMSRGDRIPGRLLLPKDAASKPVPLILFQHGLGGSKDAAYLDSASVWVRQGAAVASIDLPLHGERADAKLSQRLLGSGVDVGNAVAADTRMLWIEFCRQAVADLRRTLDALSSLPELNGRVAYAAFSLGAMLGTLYCASDPRPCAAALALAGGDLFPREVDPCAHVARISPRPILFVNATRDETVSRKATESLYASAREPKRIEWFDAGHTDLPGAALKEMWLFLRESLELG